MGAFVQLYVRAYYVEAAKIKDETDTNRKDDSSSSSSRRNKNSDQREVQNKWADHNSYSQDDRQSEKKEYTCSMKYLPPHS